MLYIEDIEKADLQESDHKYYIRVDILKMSENTKKKTLNIMKYIYIYKYVKYRCYSAKLQLPCGQDVCRRMRPTYFPDAVVQ